MVKTEKFEFQTEHDGSLTLAAAVYQAIGAASTCWENMEGAGVFQDERAKAIAEALLEKIRGEEKVVETLNRIHKSDPTVLPVLINRRIPCNDLLADDSTVQVGQSEDGHWEVGFLGILNGIVGIRDDGMGYVVAHVEDDGTLIDFAVTGE